MKSNRKHNGKLHVLSLNFWCFISVPWEFVFSNHEYTLMRYTNFNIVHSIWVFFFKNYTVYQVQLRKSNEESMNIQIILHLYAFKRKVNPTYHQMLVPIQKLRHWLCHYISWCFCYLGIRCWWKYFLFHSVYRIGNNYKVLTLVYHCRLAMLPRFLS